MSLETIREIVRQEKFQLLRTGCRHWIETLKLVVDKTRMAHDQMVLSRGDEIACEIGRVSPACAEG
jgi:hypothetical protein